MQQVLFYIPWKTAWFPQGLPVYGFGMMLFIAFLLCTTIAGRRAEKEGVLYETIQDLALWIFVGGLIGARVLYLIQDNPTSLANFFYQLPRIWDGGIILYGSVLGALVSYGIAYLLIYRHQNISTLQIADIISPSIALGLCLGRIGCFLNGCCYGQLACNDCPVVPVHFPLSAPARFSLVDEGYQTAAGFTFHFDDASDNRPRIGKVEPGSEAWKAGLRPDDLITEINDKPVHRLEDISDYLDSFSWPRGKTDLTVKVKRLTDPITFVPRTIGLHPTQIYESISMFLLFLFLTALYPFRKHHGQIVGVLMFCYGIHRYFNELLRNDPRPKGFESYTSLILIGAGLLMSCWLLLKPRSKSA